MQTEDQIFGYAAILLGAAPMASQLAMSSIDWVAWFPLFAIPSLTLLISIGHLSNSAPVQTFRKLAPIASGIGWALTWHVAEKLYAEGLRAAQNFLYIFFSMRTSLSWAVSCQHTYNSVNCVNFNEPNITTGEGHHYPDNFWPAQEFNRYLIRQNPIVDKIKDNWEPNEWYLGPSKEEFYFAFPSVPLVTAHIAIWSLIYMVVVKYQDRFSDVLTKVCIALPLALYIAVAMGMTVSGLHFGATIQEELDDKTINDDPYDFWADVRGGFRTSLLIVDYSSAFTGIVIFATSRLRVGAGHLSALYLVPAMMAVPAIQTILRAGCEGHIADVQPGYKIYASTDETISFDLLPVCFATSNFGSLWAFFYFVAQFLYSSLGPMIIYTSFIYQSFIDDMPTVQNIPKLFFGLLAACFSIPSLLLYMPLGTKVAALFRYTQQSAITQIFVFVVIFFVYGWQKIEQDVLMMNNSGVSPSLAEYLTRPTSPVYTFLLFTVVPALLCSKFVAVFDLLIAGNDISKHITAGVQFIPLPGWIAQIMGYGIMFAPVLIITIGASYTLFDFVKVHKLSPSETLRPTADWMAHASVNQNRPRAHSLAYSLFNTLFPVPIPTALFCLFIFETFIGIVLIVLFFINSLSLIGLDSTRVANDYRSTMLLVFVILHVISMFEMRQSQQANSNPNRLTLYIAVATMQTAMFNGYLWMFSSDHAWGFDSIPSVLIFCNTWIRGCCIGTAIAARAHLSEIARPSRTRDVSEIYDAEMGSAEDGDDDTPVIFDLARA